MAMGWRQAVLGALLILSLIYIQSARVIPHPSENNPRVWPPKILRHLSFSHRELMGDIYFLRGLQDIDFCSKKIAEKRCTDRSWLYQLMDLATDLHPEYQAMFRIGALALSVVLTDIDGATQLLDKARNIYPTEKRILMISAYHEIYETKNIKKAARIVLDAARNGAPPWYYTLAGRLYSQTGHKEIAKEILEEMKNEGVPVQMLQRLENRIDEK